MPTAVIDQVRRVRSGGFSSRRSRSKGNAVVELAVCLPVIVLFVMGMIELTHFIYLKQAVAAAAYEGAKVAVKSSANDTIVTQRALNVLSARNIQGGSVTVNPSAGTGPRGAAVVVTVSAPSSANRIVTPRFIYGVDARASASMVRE